MICIKLFDYSILLKYVHGAGAILAPAPWQMKWTIGAIPSGLRTLRGPFLDGSWGLLVSMETRNYKCANSCTESLK